MDNITTTPRAYALRMDDPRKEVTILPKSRNDHVDNHCREHRLFINQVEYRVAIQDDGRIYMHGIANRAIKLELRKDSVLHVPSGWIKNPEQYHKGISCVHDSCPVHGNGRKKLGKKPINFEPISPKPRKKLGTTPAESPKPRKKLGTTPAESPKPRKLGKKPINFGA